MEEVNKAFFGKHPYGRPVIGWPQEVKKLELKDAMAFYQRWYAPNNAVLVFGGDVTRQTVEPLVRQYFGLIARKDIPQRKFVQQSLVTEPSKKFTLRDPRIKTPRLLRRYPVPSCTGATEQHALIQSEALERFSEFLEDEAGSFYSYFVDDKEFASDIEIACEDGGLGPGYFQIYIQSTGEIPIAKLEQELDTFITRIVKEGIEREIFEHLKRLALGVMLHVTEEPVSKVTEILGEYLALGETLEEIDRSIDIIQKTTIDDVNAAVRKFFNTDSHMTAYLLPEEDANE